jgi:signal transduction histidine kinase
MMPENQMRELEEAREALVARDQLFSMAAHELRTPLTSLLLGLSTLDELRGDGPLGEIPEAHLERVIASANRQVRRLAHVIDSLLDVSRIQAGRLVLSPRPMDLAQLAREVVQRQEPDRVRARCPLTVWAPRAVEGCWDGARLDQVLTHLLSNAFKSAPGESVRVSVESDGSQALMAIYHEGIGIRNDGGVGLYVVKRIVEAHDGELSIESPPGQGTTFRVVLPL